jgi:hypothetical protein
MGLVLIMAIGFAALSLPTIVWASAVFTLAMTLTFVALTGCFSANERLRLPCAGFTVFCGGYLALVFVASPLQQGVSIPPLLGTAVLHALREWQAPRIGSTHRIVNQQPIGVRLAEQTIYTTNRPGAPTSVLSQDLIIDSENRPAGMTFTNAGVTYIAAPTLSWLNHRRIGHSLAAIAHGVIGVLVGFLLAHRGSQLSRTPSP